MHTTDYAAWQHDHTFGQDRRSRGERGTLIVTLLTAVFMVVVLSDGEGRAERHALCGELKEAAI